MPVGVSITFDNGYHNNRDYLCFAIYWSAFQWIQNISPKRVVVNREKEGGMGNSKLIISLSLIRLVRVQAVNFVG